jgi:hypothetical protein
LTESSSSLSGSKLPPSLNEDEIARSLERLRTERDKRNRENAIKQYYPDAGPLSREHYPKHMRFFAAGAEHRERLILAGNRTGKTKGIGAYEVALHATGEYPDNWWVGRRFERPVRIWVAGDTAITVRDILQDALLGAPGQFGSGLIPKRCVGDIALKGRPPEAVQDLYVRHVSGGTSYIGFKSYDQGGVDSRAGL